MKKIKIFIIATVVFFSGISTFGQDGFYTNLGYDITIPMGNTRDFISNTSFRGFTMSFGDFVTDNIAVEFRWSWHVFYQEMPYDEYSDGTRTVSGKQYRYINSFPLAVGGKYFFTGSGVRPYIGFGLGAYKLRKRTDMGIFYSETRQWQFGLTPEAGILYTFDNGVGIMANARYDVMFKAGDIDNQSNLAFSLGFVFSSGL